VLGRLPPALLGLTHEGSDDIFFDIFDVIGAAHASEDELAACRKEQLPGPKSCGTPAGLLGFNLNVNFSLDVDLGDIVDADFWSL